MYGKAFEASLGAAAGRVGLEEGRRSAKALVDDAFANEKINHARAGYYEKGLGVGSTARSFAS